MKRRKVLVADLLCGAGGSSTGAERALAELGLEMELVAVNHWPVAIDTHQKNHPTARHYCQDISTVRPHLIVPEGYLDLLMASPTCTHHSAARGGKPTSDQQRSDPWHIITWLTELRVTRVLIENVPEFVGWGPVDPKTGRPIQSRKGEYFRAWTDTMRRLGFELEHRILNAADYGDATTRRRFFLEARSDRKPMAWPTPSHMKRQEGVLSLGLKPWRPARDIIDWDIRGRSIFNRKKPLSAKTLQRIYAGAVKFQWPAPFLVVLRNHMSAQSIDDPVPTVAANGTHIALAQPVGKVPTFEEWHADTKDLGGDREEYDRLYGVEPFIVSAAHGNEAHERDPNSRRVKSIDEPIGAIHAGGGNFAIAEPFVLSPQTSGKPRGVSEPVSTITTGGAGAERHPGCARHAVVEPFVLSRHAGGVARSVDEPTPTQVAKQSHLLVEPAMIAPYYGSGSGETCHSPEEPLPSVTTKGRFGMVLGITHEGGDRARDPETDPLPTITTAHRGEHALITAAFGEREGQAPRVHDIAEPAPTICATGHVNLAEGIEAADGYDILFRMLEPHELAAAMGFSDEETTYEFTGTKTEKIKQIGNAVPVNTACALVKAVMSDMRVAPAAKPARARRAA